MKLHRLAVQGFGVLQDRAWDFRGASHVLLGLNEEGKTTFIDALAAALYGLPSRRGHDEFEARYDLELCRCEALLKDGGGNGLPTSSAEPAGRRWLEEPVFKSLLVIRSGECPVAGSGDFLAELTNRILGGGAVDLEAAQARIAQIASTHKANPWFKAVVEAEGHIRELEQALERADALAAAAARADGQDAAAAELEGRIKALEAGLELLGAAGRETELSRLRDLRARLEQCAERLAHREALDRAALARIETAQEGLRDLEASRAAAKARLEDAARDLEQAQAQAQARGQALAESGGSKAREAIAASLDKRERIAAGARPLPPLWRKLAAALAGAAGAALAFHVGGVLAAILAGAAMALAAWLGLGYLPDPQAQAAERAEDELKVLIQNLAPDWADLSLDEVRRRLEAQRAEAAKAEAARESAQELRDRKAGELEALKAGLEESGAQLEGLKQDLRQALKPWGVESQSQARDKLSRLEEDRRLEREYLREAAASLGRELKDSREADAALRERLSGLESEVARLPADSPKLAPEEIEARSRRQRRELDGLKAQLKLAAGQALKAREERSRLEGGLGRKPAELFAQLQRERLRLEDLKLWRRAAELAAGEIERLAQDAGSGLKACVQESSALFAQLSAGRYTAAAGDGLGAADLRVRHAAQGEKPALWMSSGARDLLWLALRITLARQALPEPGFMVLDEPCLNLDPGRARAAVEALFKSPDLAGWQILVLTKDDRVAAAGADAGAARISLGEG